MNNIDFTKFDRAIDLDDEHDWHWDPDYFDRKYAERARIEVGVWVCSKCGGRDRNAASLKPLPQVFIVGKLNLLPINIRLSCNEYLLYKIHAI
jgi:hypothetical protein